MSEAKEEYARTTESTRDLVDFRGHRLVRSTHPTTIELTTEEYLTENGDCIIGVGASKGCQGLNPSLKARIKKPGSRIKLKLSVGGMSFEVNALGDPRLELTDPHEIVVRRSGHASDRTLAVSADAASRDIPREIVRLLKNPATKGTLEISVT